MLDKEFCNDCKTKSIISVDYTAIEQLIDRHYGAKAGFKDSFELPCIEERGNYQDWDVEIRKEEIDEYDLEYLTPNDKGRYRNFSTLTLLTDLCNKGIIPDGDYLIEIFW